MPDMLNEVFKIYGVLLESGLVRKIRYYGEYLLWGGFLREKVLIKLLEKLYFSKFRREWKLSKNKPHFEDQKLFFFDFAFTDRKIGPEFLNRGFFASEVIKAGDSLLDIGCGDGFFSKRFYADRYSFVDAIDIEPSAIKTATTYNSGPNIKYFLCDAVKESFPHDKYNVIAWDGAIGHFAYDDIRKMLDKISKSLSEEGIFVGSESLGHEGSDHLIIFETIEDVHNILKQCFEFIQLRQVNYRLNWADGFMRKEVYWRCANNPTRMQECGWHNFF